MGDRANVKVKEGNSVVYLYTHWAGSDLQETLRRVMKRRQRWEDGQYLARIIFSEMIKGNIDGETGYGISSTVGDGEDRILVVDIDERKINGVSFEAFAKGKKVKWVSEDH